MNFTLYYNGPLKPNAKPEHKHEIRKEFHKQLVELWRQEPLSFLGSPSDYKEGFFREVAGRSFVALVTEFHKALVDLDIVLLRPERPGAIVSHGGDIDNRLKTLFDALSVPQKNQIPKGKKSPSDESPLHCLLEDDRLIESFRVESAQWLNANARETDVVLLIRVRTRVIIDRVNNWVLK